MENTTNKFEYIVKPVDEGLTYRELVKANFTFSSRLMTKLKKNDLIFINGERIKLYFPSKAGDIISISLPDESSDFVPEDIKITPVFEDDDLLVINKQAGIVVHPTKGHPSHTIANGIAKYIIDTNQNFKLRFVNRLDMDTSGLLIISKNSHGQDSLTKQMKENKVAKKYVALVKGNVQADNGTIDAPIGLPDAEKVQRCVMADGSPSVTHFKVLERFTSGYTLVELLLETGRTHQIRVHMSHIGHPILGDELYGGENPWLMERQALHAKYLSFYHPVTNDFLEVEAELPEDMLSVIEKLK